MFLDIGVGILTAILVSNIFGLPLTAVFLLLGIIFSLLMDADFILHLVKTGTSKNAYRHRELFHRPLIYIPLGMLILSFYNSAYAVLFGLASLFHFLHDSIGIGWGVQWLYPLTTDHYGFFYRYQSKHKEKLPQKLLYVWKDDELDMLAKRYGDEEEIKNIYLKWHPYAIVEFSVFIVAMVVLIFSKFSY